VEEPAWALEAARHPPSRGSAVWPSEAPRHNTYNYRQLHCFDGCCADV